MQIRKSQCHTICSTTAETDSVVTRLFARKPHLLFFTAQGPIFTPTARRQRRISCCTARGLIYVHITEGCSRVVFGSSDSLVVSCFRFLDDGRQINDSNGRGKPKSITFRRKRLRQANGCAAYAHHGSISGFKSIEVAH